MSRGIRIRRAKRLWLLAGALVLASSVRCGQGLREDELECERAAIHVQECCPGVPDRAFACELVEGCDTTSQPDLDADEARCLRTTSCRDLAATCATLLTPVSTGGAAGSTTVSPPTIRNRSICLGQPKR